MVFWVRRGLAVMGAISVILLALTRIGVSPVAPGLATGFHPEQACPAGSVCFATDGGDINALATLWVESTAGPTG
ncbi:MAG TPA: hypothetical protein VF613_15475, partial [Longimicrobium sp.]